MCLFVRQKDVKTVRHSCNRCLIILFPGLLLIPLAIYAQVMVPDEVASIFEKRCASWGCHAGPGAPKNLDLTLEFVLPSLINKPSSQKPEFLRVKPGDPENSYLVMKIKGDPRIDGERMPRGSEPLAEAEIATIESWINQLAIAAEFETPEHEYLQAFPGWTLSNLPTTQTIETGNFLFRIAHRWRGRTEEGLEDLFGLDQGAHMFTQLAFPITDDLTVSAARSSEKATYEFAGKWRFLRERDDARIPIAAAITAGVDWLTTKQIVDPDNPDAAKAVSRTDSERFHWFVQLALSKRLREKISLLLVPGMLLNGNVYVSGEDPILTLGLVGKVLIFKDFSLFAEWVPILSGEEDAATLEGVRIENGERVFSDMFATGVEYKIGGHVFHLYITNSLGLATNQHMSGGKLDFADGDFRLGFNIYRIFQLPF